MILYNPTNDKVSMMYAGVEYEIPAQSTIEVSTAVGLHWTGVIHKFLMIEDEKIKTKDDTKEVPCVQEDSVEISTQEAEIVEEVVTKKKKK